jgi:prephenate dehydrogenase
MAEAAFSRVAILGTGLVGGSFALALRKHFPETRIVGWDRAQVLERAKSLAAIDEAAASPAAAVRDAELVYLALPVVRAIDLLPEIARHAAPQALVTDTAGTKVAIVRAAEAHLRPPVLFLGGHPVAGKELAGIEHAAAELFQGARYALVRREADGEDERVGRFVRLLGALGAEAVWCDAETHDWAMAIVSHLPQLIATALAGVVLDETDETGMPLSLAGPAVQEMTRLAASPYDTWRDICLTNTENIARSLDRMAQALEQLRRTLRSRDLEKEFAAGNELYRLLRQPR